MAHSKLPSGRDYHSATSYPTTSHPEPSQPQPTSFYAPKKSPSRAQLPEQDTKLRSPSQDPETRPFSPELWNHPEIRRNNKLRGRSPTERPGTNSKEDLSETQDLDLDLEEMGREDDERIKRLFCVSEDEEDEDGEGSVSHHISTPDTSSTSRTPQDPDG
jgi:hypothetical protein